MLHTMNNWRSVDRAALWCMAVLLLATAGCTGSGDQGGKGMDMPEGMDMTMDTGMHQGMAMPMKTDMGPISTELEAALRSPNAFVISNVETAIMERKELSMDLEATGLITYDPRGIRTVSARTAGWVERLYAKYRYQPVQRGQKLMDLYSRELVTEQENYLFLLRQEPKDAVMLAAGEKRLALLGLTNEQIADVRTSGKVERTITYFSPSTGHLHEDDRTDPGPAASAMAASASSAQELALREGGYVEKGQTIFTVYGTSTVLALLNVHPADGQDRITVGQRVSVSIDGSNGMPMEGAVDLVEPVYRQGTSVVSVRVYLPNSGDSLRIGSRITATLHLAERRVLAVPASAIVSTGLHSYVFVKEHGGFRSRPVITGTRSGEWIELRSGISEQDTIARNAQLLIDSEGFLKIASP